MPRCLWAVAVTLALAMAAPHACATVTSINTFGNGNGTERCLIGNASGRCTGGGTFQGAYSIASLFSAWTGRNLTRVDDAQDKVWSAGSFGYIEIAGVAHYLSTSGTSYAGVWVDDGKFAGSELKPFPAGTEVSPPDNRTSGVLLAGEQITSDILMGRAFESSFIGMTFAAATFELVYRSRFSGGGVAYYSSDNTSRGFDNRVVSGKTLDHMVTWYAGQRIDGRHNVADVYLIAFERAHHDDDFQDGVYALSIPLQQVPEPPAWMVLALGLGLTAWLRSRTAP